MAVSSTDTGAGSGTSYKDLYEKEVAKRQGAEAACAAMRAVIENAGHGPGCRTLSEIIYSKVKGVPDRVDKGCSGCRALDLGAGKGFVSKDKLRELVTDWRENATEHQAQSPKPDCLACNANLSRADELELLIGE